MRSSIPSGNTSARLRSLNTVQDVLDVLPKNKLRGCLYTAANHVSKVLNVSLDQLAIDSLIDLPHTFKLYLKERRYKANSIRCYVGFAKLLVKKAKELGWTTDRAEVPEPWRQIFAAVKHNGCARVVRYAVRLGISPVTFSDDDLRAWGDTLLADKCSYKYVECLKRRFRRSIAKGHLGTKLPQLSLVSRRAAQYGVALRSFPSTLRLEAEALLMWKQAEFAPGRPQRSHHRAVTAWRLKSCIEQLYGFVTIVNNGNGSTTQEVSESHTNDLPALISQSNVIAWVSWRINERKNSASGVTCDLGLLHAAMRYYPKYKAYDFRWFDELISQLPKDPESMLVERKTRKYVPYEVLADIPRKLHEERKEIRAHGSKQLAWLVHDELLMRWLVTLVWRQRNIRECRIGRNLFKGPIPPFVTVAKPKRVEETLAMEPGAEVWQFYFREAETKNGREVRAFLPRQLINPLEEYLEHFRPVLLQGRDPGTLFLNRVGEPLTSEGFRSSVVNLTFRYTQRMVTPHICRDILAYKWLDDHPEDYLTLSKILWHRSINTTLQKYGRRFDESNGVRKLEEWLGGD